MNDEDARLRLAEAARRVIAELTSSSASSEAFEQARDLVERAADVLANREHEREYHEAEASLFAEYSSSRDFLMFSPLIGPLNPLAPPMRLRFEGDTVVGSATFGDAYEGPPGCVHGGFVAAAFDEVLGMTQSLTGSPGMTGQLDVSYRSPTPLHRELRFEGRVDRVDGRKIYTSATLHAGDRLCATSTGLFLSMKPEVFERLRRERARRSD